MSHRASHMLTFEGLNSESEWSKPIARKMANQLLIHLIKLRGRQQLMFEGFGVKPDPRRRFFQHADCVKVSSNSQQSHKRLQRLWPAAIIKLSIKWSFMAVSWLMVYLKTGDRGKQKQDGHRSHNPPYLFFWKVLCLRLLCPVFLIHCSSHLFFFRFE